MRSVSRLWKLKAQLPCKEGNTQRHLDQNSSVWKEARKHTDRDTHSLSLSLRRRRQLSNSESTGSRHKPKHIIHNAEKTQCCTRTTQNQFKHELVAVLQHPKNVTSPNAKRLHSLGLKGPSLLFSSSSPNLTSCTPPHSQLDSFDFNS